MDTKVIDGKKVIIKSKKNVPPLAIVKSVYSKIPDDKKIPVVFQTKTQYLNEYIKNQEKARGKPFPKEEKRRYLATELANMSNIVSRYTTRHNPYIDVRTVFFTDRKMSPTQFNRSALHEYAHEAWEDNPSIRKAWKGINRKSSPTWYGKTSKQEDFAESFMLQKSGLPIDRSRNKIISDIAPSGTVDLAEFDINHDGQVNDKDIELMKKRGMITKDGSPNLSVTSRLLDQASQARNPRMIEKVKNTLYQSNIDLSGPSILPPTSTQVNALVKVKKDMMINRPKEYDTLEKFGPLVGIPAPSTAVTLGSKHRALAKKHFKETGNFDVSLEELGEGLSGVIPVDVHEKLALGQALGLDKGFKEFRKSQDKDFPYFDDSPNSVADALGLSVPADVLSSASWKLYGAPKGYDPRIDEANSLKDNIYNITSRHYASMGESPIFKDSLSFSEVLPEDLGVPDSLSYTPESTPKPTPTPKNSATELFQQGNLETYGERYTKSATPTPKPVVDSSTDIFQQGSLETYGESYNPWSGVEKAKIAGEKVGTVGDFITSPFTPEGVGKTTAFLGQRLSKENILATYKGESRPFIGDSNKYIGGQKVQLGSAALGGLLWGGRAVTKGTKEGLIGGQDVIATKQQEAIESFKKGFKTQSEGLKKQYTELGYEATPQARLESKQAAAQALLESPIIKEKPKKYTVGAQLKDYLIPGQTPKTTPIQSYIATPPVGYWGTPPTTGYWNIRGIPQTPLALQSTYPLGTDIIQEKKAFILQ